MYTESEELRNLYFEETREHLENINECLLELDVDRSNAERVNGLFRSVHTIKGSTAAMNYVKTANLVHRTEDMIQAVRDGKASLDDQMIHLLFIVHDHLEEFIDTVFAGGSEDSLNSAHIYEELCGIMESIAGDRRTAAPAAAAQPVQPEAPAAVQQAAAAAPIDLDPQQIQELIGTGDDPVAIRVTLTDDCMLRSVRMWMVLQELERLTAVCGSVPPKPSMEAFKTGTDGLDVAVLDCIAFSDMLPEELETELSANLTEIKDIHIESLEIREQRLHGTFLAYDQSSGQYRLDQQRMGLLDLDLAQALTANETVNPPAVTYSLEFIHEILHSAREAEVIFLGLGSGEMDERALSPLYKSFHKMKGVALYIRHDLLSTLTRETERLIDLLRTGRIEYNGVALNLAANSLTFLAEVCQGLLNGVSEPLDKLRQDIEAHTELLKDGVLEYLNEVTPHPVAGLTGNQRLGEVLVGEGKLSEVELEQAVQMQQSQYPQLKLGQVLVKEKKASLHDVREIITAQEAGRKESQENRDIKDSKETKAVNYVRIPEYKVDSLFDMLGELIILQSLHKEEVTCALAGGDVPSLYNNTVRMERITRDIQAVTMTLRMVSIKQTFQKILRIGRDTARDLGKQIDFEVLGEDTEVDRGVVEKLHDPLMHLVRNAVSHGIESAEQRQAAGKPAVGKVKIAAWNKKGTVYIEISDDGQGIDPVRVLAKAQEKGMTRAEREYSEAEIVNFIFLPGFSTQEQVNQVSGRGVGMNVVEAEIKKAGGRVEVKNATGHGAAFFLKIPVNLATVNGIVVNVSGQRYVLPTMSIKRIFRPEASDWVSVTGQIELVKNRGELIRLIQLQSLQDLGMTAGSLDGHVAVVLEHDGDYRALPVQEMLGKQEVVIKPLDEMFSHLGFLSGSTIMGDGKAAFILDVESLFNRG